MFYQKVEEDRPSVFVLIYCEVRAVPAGWYLS